MFTKVFFEHDKFLRFLVLLTILIDDILNKVMAVVLSRVPQRSVNLQMLDATAAFMSTVVADLEAVSLTTNAYKLGHKVLEDSAILPSSTI